MLRRFARPQLLDYEAVVGAPKLDSDFISPFLRGAAKTLKIQCKTDIKFRKSIAVSDAKIEEVDISSSLALQSPGFTGILAMWFPKKTFLTVMQRMLGTEFTEIDEDLADGACELLNIILGEAKSVLNEQGFAIEKAIPQSKTGDQLRKGLAELLHGFVVPISSTAGSFYIFINIENGEV